MKIILTLITNKNSIVRLYDYIKLTVLAIQNSIQLLSRVTDASGQMTDWLVEFLRRVKFYSKICVWIGSRLIMSDIIAQQFLSATKL